jgi:hypothetical protein
MAEEKKEEPAKAAAPAADKKAGKKGGGAFVMILCGLVFGASVWFIYPSLLLLLGMIPTLVAIFTINDEKQGSAITAIGVMNAAGVSPFLVELWQKGQTIGNALDIIRAPESWVVMFGAAAVGQLILFAVPQAIAFATVANAEARIKLLKDNLERLKVVWGPDVATTKSLDKVARGE